MIFITIVTKFRRILSGNTLNWSLAKIAISFSKKPFYPAILHLYTWTLTAGKELKIRA